VPCVSGGSITSCVGGVREGVLARRGRACQDNNRQSGWSAVRGARGADAAMAGRRLFICAIDRFQREKDNVR
jgi:hypothetical protein